MSMIQGPITDRGAIVCVLVGVSEAWRRHLRAKGRPAPAEVPVSAEIDTGSAFTAFLPSVFTRLGIRPVGTTRVITPSTAPDAPCLLNQYDVTVTLVSGMARLTLPRVRAIAAVGFRQGDEAEAIIGRDVLNHCVFSYYGHDRTFSLAFPT